MSSKSLPNVASAMPARRTAPPAEGRWPLRLSLIAIPLAVWLAHFAVPEPPPRLPPALFLLLHTAMEVARIVMMAVAVTLMLRKPPQAATTGGAMLTAALIGAAPLVFLHAMSVDGMPLSGGPAGAQASVVFWLAGRTLLATGLLTLALLPPSRRSTTEERSLSAAAAVLAGSAVVAWALAAPAPLPGAGLQAVEQPVELLLCAVFVFSAWRIGQHADRADGPAHYGALALAALLAAVGELCIATASHVDDTLHLLGHACVVLSYTLIARAAYVISVREPMRQFGTLAQALSATLHPSLLCDRDGFVRWSNPAFERACGYGAAEAAGLPMAAMSGVDPEQGPDPSLAAMANGIAWHGQVAVRRRDGSVFIESRSVTPIERDDGRISGFVVVGEDVTTRIEVQRQLVEREQTYRALMDTATDGVWIVDADGRVVEANEAYARRSGWSRSQLEGMPIGVLDAMHDADAARGRILAVAEAGHLQFETEHRTRDGQRWPVEVTANQGTPGGARIFVFLRDLTQRRAAEQALREREAKLRGLFELSPVGIALCRMDGGLVEFNEAYRRLTGHDAETLQRLSYWTLTPPEYLEAERQLVPLIEREGRYGPHEKEYVRADGSRVPVRLNGVRLLIRGAPHIWSIVEDLTPTRAVEAEQRRLQQQQLQSQKLEALGQLAGGIAHDFNNMLAGVLGLSSLALEHHAGPPESPLGRYLAEIVRTCDHGRDLVAKLLAYGRAQADEPAQPRDVGAPVAQMHELLASSLPRGIRFDSRAAPSLPPVRINAVDVQQIVMNLVINARDAIGEHGCVELKLARAGIDGETCSACGAPVAGEHVVLSVRDDGVGIPEPLHAKVFDPFFSTKGVGKGSGLGLSTVLGIVHKAGGHLQLRSAPGRGTTMRVLLPAALNAVPPVPHPPARAPAPSDDAGGLVVWVVDDDPTVRLLLVEVLAMHDHTVRAFEDPREVLPALAATDAPPAVLVTDQTMPGLSGIDLASAVLARHPAIAVVLCTGYSEHVDEQAALARGVSAYLRKPFHPRALLDAVAAAARGLATTA